MTGWNAQTIRATSTCAFHTHHAHSLVIASVQALHPCDVVENGAGKLDGVRHVHLLFHPFQSQTHLHPFHRTLQTWEARKYHAS